MKVAYLIDHHDSLGGGMEYIRRRMDEWASEEIVVNHLKALVQLLGNPLKRLRMRVTCD